MTSMEKLLRPSWIRSCGMDICDGILNSWLLIILQPEFWSLLRWSFQLVSFPQGNGEMVSWYSQPRHCTIVVFPHHSKLTIHTSMCWYSLDTRLWLIILTPVKILNRTLWKTIEQPLLSQATTGLQNTAFSIVKQPYGCFQNSGIPKWMVKIMENPMNKWMIWGVKTPIFGSTPISEKLRKFDTDSRHRINIVFFQTM